MLNFSVRKKEILENLLSYNCCYNCLSFILTNVIEQVIPLCIHTSHSQYGYGGYVKYVEEKEEILQLIAMIFYGSERIICLDISDLSCGNNISAELTIHVICLYSADTEHLGTIISYLHRTSGNFQKGRSVSAWTALV